MKAPRPLFAKTLAELEAHFSGGPGDAERLNALQWELEHRTGERAAALRKSVLEALSQIAAMKKESGNNSEAERQAAVRQRLGLRPMRRPPAKRPSPFPPNDTP